MLTAIKLVHTVIWAILAASIVAVPIAGVLRRFGSPAALPGTPLAAAKIADSRPEGLRQWNDAVDEYYRRIESGDAI